MGSLRVLMPQVKQAEKFLVLPLQELSQLLNVESLVYLKHLEPSVRLLLQ
jgi:hypothetical protein